MVEMLDLAVIAAGETSAGERWYLRAGGSADDYYTMLETVHPDGHRDEGGMGGPVCTPIVCSISTPGGPTPGRCGLSPEPTSVCGSCVSDRSGASSARWGPPRPTANSA